MTRAGRSTGSAGRRASQVVAAAAAIALGTALVPGTAQAADSYPTVFNVNYTADMRDVDLADDVCDADPGPAQLCTLRAAVMQGNVTPGDISIRLFPRTYKLTIPGAGEDLGAKGDLDLVGRIEIVGASNSRARSTIDATGVGDRVFDGRSPAAALRNLVITGGYLPSTTTVSTEFDGGGIRNARRPHHQRQPPAPQRGRSRRRPGRLRGRPPDRPQSGQRQPGERQEDPVGRRRRWRDLRHQPPDDHSRLDDPEQHERRHRRRDHRRAHLLSPHSDEDRTLAHRGQHRRKVRRRNQRGGEEWRQFPARQLHGQRQLRWQCTAVEYPSGA